MSDADKKYNGWTNYETWCVNLWMDNEQGSQEYARERAEECYRNAEKGDDRKHDATCELADMLKEEHEEAQPEVSGVYADLLGAAMSEVNWYEIAEHIVSDVADEIDEEEKEEQEDESDDDKEEAEETEAAEGE